MGSKILRWYGHWRSQRDHYIIAVATALAYLAE
jgi:hypothetical protein